MSLIKIGRVAECSGYPTVYLYRSIIAFLAIIFTFGQCSGKELSELIQVKFDKCSDGELTPNAVSILPCDDSPCRFHVHKGYYFEESFSPPADSKSLVLEVQLQPRGSEPKIALSKDMCQWLRGGASCPLKEMGIYHLIGHISFDDENDISDDPVTIKYRLIGDNDKVVSCFKMPAYVRP